MASRALWRKLRKHWPLVHSGTLSVGWNKLRNEFEFRWGRAQLKSRPWNVILETTRNCNLACPMCRDRVAFDPGLDMPVELAEKCLAELAPTMDVLDLRSQGEAMLARTWHDILQLASQHTVKFELVTNGTLLTENHCRELARNRFRVRVSFDGASKEVFEQIRVGASQSKVVAGIKRLVQTYRESGVSTTLLALQVTAQRQNIQEIPAIVQQASDLGLGGVYIHPINHGGDNSLTACLPQAREMFAKAVKIGFEKGLEVVEVPQLDEPDSSLVGHPDKAIAQDGQPVSMFTCCREPWKTVNIAYDGSVHPCCILPTPSLGNLYEDSFDTIWNGPAYRHLRAEINGPNPPEPCRSCPVKNVGRGN